ncbi:carbohydrate ABC transporter permease [Cohnella lupini]|uniref:Carbohydrate ABC transporter membrane protein 1 (CUT1 family) n=1 Tax=Cohnella lupini TaxID=1294267 RepID=A0A3D9IX43_9BACL|nr:sugar ABC transporter permease [Cohnella lupini]RED66285.1 carbohydrate ABC transporter membrane protein 1 (CUT1 family) [Cohnella lupini]
MGNKLAKFKEAAFGFGFLMPSLLGFGIFLFYPFFKSVYLSLHSTNPRGQIVDFVWFDNFKDILGSEHFYQSIKISFLFALMTIPTCLIISLCLALLTHKKNKINIYFQLIFASSIAIPIGNASVIWKILFHPTAGMFNYFLSFLGIDPIGWLTDPAYALISVSIMTVWISIGFTYLVLLSGIKGIPEDLYESAKMDGAGSSAMVRKITLPLLSPAIFFMSVISVIGALQSFSQINILTEGGPANSTNVVVYDLYQEAFVNYRFGTGSAQAIILFLIILLFTIVQFRIAERKVHYS